jgi:hypothetical protein
LDAAKREGLRLFLEKIGHRPARWQSPAFHPELSGN